MLALWLAPVNASAQTVQYVLGNGNAKIEISSDQRLIFEADQKVVRKEYRAADTLYSQAIAINPNNIAAYLQRGIVRREMGNEQGAVADGRMAATLANNALHAAPRDFNLYYQRGMGFRLMKDFDQAHKDVTTAIQLGGPANWQTDLQAIALEKKLEKSKQGMVP